MRRRTCLSLLLVLLGARGLRGATCGNGALEAGELCDGDSRLCGALASSYADDGRLAVCRPSCDGYDVSSCQRVVDGNVEMVKPRARQPSRYAYARCNAGTPFGFEVAAAPPGGQLDTWAIVLQGGGDCDDFSLDCSQRTGPLSTGPRGADRSRSSPSSHFAGLLAGGRDNNPRFHDANRVFAYYCSSDMWTGGGTTQKITTTAGDWYFNGRQNVSALLDMLKQRYGLDDANPTTRVALAGTSAGGVGVFADSELVRSLLPRSSAGGRVKLIVDGAWEPDWSDPAHPIKNAPPATPDIVVMNHKADFYEATLISTCEAAYPAEKGRCMMLGFAHPYLIGVGLPVFIQTSSRDSAATMEVHGIPADDSDGSLTRWKQLMLAEFAAAPYPWQFSPDTLYHTITTKNGARGWEKPFEDTTDTYRSMLHRFWDDDFSGEERRITP